MKDITAIILAAGKGTRMKSETPKVLHKIAGEYLISWVLDSVKTVVDDIAVIVGHEGERVKEAISDENILFVEQKELLGTGHAVMTAVKEMPNMQKDILVLCGDTPLIKKETLAALVEYHQSAKNRVTFLTTILTNPTGYGRVVKDRDGNVIKIVEQKDANRDELKIQEVNSGIYCFNTEFLKKNIFEIKNGNSQGEFYLTDLIQIASGSCKTVSVDEEELLGINDRIQLAEASKILKKRINHALMLSGVTIIDPETTYIDKNVEVGIDTTIYPNVFLQGNTSIGKSCVISPNVTEKKKKIGDNCNIKASSDIEDSTVCNKVSIGPMAHLRPDTYLEDEVKIGNFVETKKITMGKGSKASHLTYLGDAKVGKDANIGCGTITCNYDGVKKHKTIIGDGAFIGSDVQLVAPVIIGENAVVAAGTTITENVPDNALALGRIRQRSLLNWKNRKKKE